MLTGPAAIAAFILTFLPVLAFDALEKRRRIATLRLLARTGLVTALYCVAAGIALLAGWTDPVATAVAAGSPGMPSEADGAALAAHALRYWPHGLIAVGCFWTIVYGAAHRGRLRT